VFQAVFCIGKIILQNFQQSSCQISEGKILETNKILMMSKLVLERKEFPSLWMGAHHMRSRGEFFPHCQHCCSCS
jgi:hypothetical protein